MKYFFIFLLLIIALPLSYQAQINTYGCQADSMSQFLLYENPQWLPRWINAYHAGEENTSTFQSVNRSTPYIIPVVVHVIHYDGTENISDEQIRNGIDILTRNYRKQNPDTAEIVSPFKPIAADMEIEFRLATIDPDGQCSNGINRLRSPLSITGDHTVKDLIHWPRNNYVNIYIVRNAAGLAGHALMPFQADSIPDLDGIVLSGDYMGNIGTSDNVRSMVLSHEMGHFFNLYHIWGGNNVPGFYYLPCGQPANCNEDDGVFDTPNTIGWQSCNLAGASCGNPIDNVQNFMDYSYCGRMFTEGQKQRVHAALNNPIAQRNELWSLSNLAATGVDVPAGLCKADFTINRQIACEGDSIQLTDASFHHPNQWIWDFGDTQSANIQNPKHAYNSAGHYTVKLTAGNGSQTVEKTKRNALSVISPTGQSLPFYEDFEYRDSLTETGLHLFSEFNTNWTLNTTYGSNGHQSVFIPCNADTLSYQYALYTPGFDFTQVQQPVFSFTYAFAKKQDDNKDILKVKISKDCGQYWITRLTISDTLPTAPNQSTNFEPTATEWKRVSVTNIPISYLTSNLLFKIEFTSAGGNQLFIDEINVYDMQSIGLELQQTSDQIHIFPNPGYASLHIESPVPVNAWQVFSTTGQLLLQGAISDDTQSLNLTGVAPGIYLISLHTNNGIVWKKWICQ